jgi:hypothetical protein
MKIILLPVFLAVFLLSHGIASAQTLFWTLNTRDAVLEGDSDGVTVDDAGLISLAPSVSSKYDTGEQFVWSSAADSSGNTILGTGGNGKVFKIDKNGKGSLLFDSAELNAAAVAVGQNDEVFVGTSPDGKVYKIDSKGNSSVYFEPKTKYIWSLAIGKDGALFVGTGETGRIFKVTGPAANPDTSIFYDSRETHIICLAVDSDGALYAGTDSSGLVLKIGNDKTAFAVLDTAQREIHEISIGPDNSVYALALSESASVKKPAEEEKKESKEKTVSVPRPNPSVPFVAPTPAPSRYDFKSTKSAVYRIRPGGANDVLWNSSKTAAFSIAADPNGGGVFVGTADRGRIFRISDAAREELLIQTDEEQISTMIPVGAQIAATTSNKGRTFRFGPSNVNSGKYVSPVLDAQSTAMWGRIWSQKTGNVTLETRSGNSARPGDTWSKWSTADSATGKILSPQARYFQWRAELQSGSNSTVRETTVSFAASNIAPEILSIEILPSNVGLAPNPPVPVDPNIAALGLNPADFGLAVVSVPPRRVFQTGARGIQWAGSDRNGDQLLYRVFIKKFEDAEFRQIGGMTSENFVTLDGLSMDDGRYVVKIVADDSPSNGGAFVKTGERISKPFDFDNSAPVVKLIGKPARNGETVKIRFGAKESVSHMKRAEYRVNGGKWMPVYADDGIVDGQSETFTIDAKVGADPRFTITFRVFDAVGNVGSARASE